MVPRDILGIGLQNNPDLCSPFLSSAPFLEADPAFSLPFFLWLTMQSLQYVCDTCVILQFNILYQMTQTLFFTRINGHKPKQEETDSTILQATLKFVGSEINKHFNCGSSLLPRRR